MIQYIRHVIHFLKGFFSSIINISIWIDLTNFHISLLIKEHIHHMLWEFIPRNNSSHQIALTILACWNMNVRQSSHSCTNYFAIE